MKKLDQLTGWRFIAAFGVILCHFQDLLFPNAPQLVHKTLSGFANFVDFFFVLSGFILAYNYQKKFVNGTTSVRQFLSARFARIYPACIFSLAVGLPAFLFINHQTHAPLPELGLNALLSLLMLKTWFPFLTWPHITSWNGPMWSIETEFFFYLCFPFLVVRLAKLNQKSNWFLWILVGLVITALSVAYDLIIGPTGKEPFAGAFELVHSSPYVCVLEFIMGIITFNLATNLQEGSLTKLRRHALWMAPLLGVFYLASNATLPVMSTFQGIPTIIFALVILISFTEPTPYKPLGTSPMVYMGEVSFSLYLLHIPIRTLFEYVGKIVHPLGGLKESNSTFYGVLVIAASLAVAAFCYKYVEDPARKKIRKILAA